MQADGTKSGEQIIRTAGFSAWQLLPTSGSRVRQVHTSKADAHYLAVDTVAYSYNEANGQLTFSGGKLDASLSGTFTLETIDGNGMTLRGPVFAGTEGAAYGLYLFERMPEKEMLRLETIWDDRQLEMIPVQATPIELETFLSMVKAKIWTYRAAYPLHEDGSLGALMVQSGVPHYEHFFFEPNGAFGGEYYNKENPDEFFWGTYCDMRYNDNFLHIEGAVLESLRNVFLLWSVNEDEMVCVGFPTEEIREADPVAVRAFYYFRRTGVVNQNGGTDIL